MKELRGWVLNHPMTMGRPITAVPAIGIQWSSIGPMRAVEETAEPPEGPMKSLKGQRNLADQRGRYVRHRAGSPAVCDQPISSEAKTHHTDSYRLRAAVAAVIWY